MSTLELANFEKLIGQKGGGIKKYYLELYNIKVLKQYAVKLNIKTTKIKNKKMVNLTKEELIKKIKNKI
jgi:hypothetical protein